MPNADRITAIKVAPGIIQLIDTENEKEDFVYRDADPRTYYWYADESPEYDIDKLEKWAERAPMKPGQTNLSEFSEGEEGAPGGYGEEVHQAVASAAGAAVIKAAEDEMELEDAADIANDVYEMMEQDADLVEGAVE
jgi:hypothetical protein